jgi:amino-acid N-acetyltransferase
MMLRAARAGDHAAVLGLLEAAGLPLAGVPAGLDDFIVAEQDGRVVGAVGLERYGQSALLRSAVVEPGLRGTGVGASLVEGVLTHARERGARDVYLLTTTADQWFPRFGFVRIEAEAVPASVRTSVEFREACPASAAVLRKDLAS